RRLYCYDTALKGKRQRAIIKAPENFRRGTQNPPPRFCGAGRKAMPCALRCNGENQMKEPIAALRALEHKNYAYTYAQSVMTFDAETGAPAESAAGRAE